MNKTKRISEIVDQMIEDTGLSNRGLAREINDCMDSENAISYQAVRNWRLGLNKPLPFLFEVLRLKAEDKRMQRFALDILEVLESDDIDGGDNEEITEGQHLSYNVRSGVRG